MLESPCRFRILHVELRVFPMRTRFPFRYGIASLTALPHLFVQVEIEIDGENVSGLTSEGLPPKWFTKNPESSTEQDLAEMIAVIQNAVRLSPLITREPLTFYEWWQSLHKEIDSWASRHGFPPLLSQLGISLMERAILDALCKKRLQPLHQVIKANVLGIDFGDVHTSLQGCTAEEFLPAVPVSSTAIRHTVGLSDPLRFEEIPAAEKVLDGLPQALDSCISAYGLTFFKIKLSGKLEIDQPRLRKITDVLESFCPRTFSVTLDGNENFDDIDDFRTYFEALQADETLHVLLRQTLWVEQPIHRDKALSDRVGPALQNWPDAPLLIIDESDGACGDAHRALKLGYSGVSHKNCKGIVKGLLNAALLYHYRRLHPKKTFIHSGEDLANVGPLALTQDLAMQALLGMDHVERNGHHYFRGLSMYPHQLDELSAQAHPDLYEKNQNGLITLNVQDGRISLNSVNRAPFGCSLIPDISIYLTIKEWIYSGGISDITA